MIAKIDLNVGDKVMVLPHCLIAEVRGRLAYIVGKINMNSGTLYELSIPTTTYHNAVVWDDEIERCEVW